MESLLFLSWQLLNRLLDCWVNAYDIVESVNNWTDVVVAISSLEAAIFTGVMMVMACKAWKTAKETLEAQREAYEQSRKDSIAQTRPYVSATIVPGLQGMGIYDLLIKNSGKSAARNLTLSFSNWPTKSDVITESLRELMQTKRILTPGERLRVMWRMDLRNTDSVIKGSDGNVVGMPDVGTITVAYKGMEDVPEYQEIYDVLIKKSGLWPWPKVGPSDLNFKCNDMKNLHRIGEEIVRRIAELNR